MLKFSLLSSYQNVVAFDYFTQIHALKNNC